MGRRRGLPSDEVFCFGAELLVRWEVQVPRPVDDLAVCVVGLLCAERRPADQALEHDRSHRPPITAKVITLATEDLRGDVIWCADGRVGELSPRFTPGVNLCAVANGKLDLVEVHRIPIVAGGLVRSASK